MRRKRVVLRNGNMADNHARSITSLCDCQAWLPQERGEVGAHEVVRLEWWKKKQRRLIDVDV